MLYFGCNAIHKNMNKTYARENEIDNNMRLLSLTAQRSFIMKVCRLSCSGTS